MTTTNTNCEVSIPSKRLINRIKNSVGYKWCKNHLKDDIIYTTLKECNMDQDETCRRLTMIHDVRKVASKYSVDDVYTMLKECNMDPSEASERLLYIDTFQEVKKKKDTRKTASNGNTVQEVEKKKDTGKTVSDTVQGVEKKKDTGKTVRDTFQEVEKKKHTQKSIGNWDNQQPRPSREHENFYSSKVYNDAGRRNLTPGKEYRVTNNHVKRVWRPISPVDSTRETNVTHMANSAADVNGKLAISNTSHSHKLTTASTINTHSASNELKMSSPKA
ncbi:GBF-interacting protein 1-like protein isoform X1 [Tanacetum coccineum]